MATNSAYIHALSFYNLAQFARTAQLNNNQAVVLGYLINKYNTLHAHGKIGANGEFYDTVECCNAATAVKATSQNSFLKEFAKKGWLEISYKGADKRRHIAFTSKFIAENPLFFGLATSKNGAPLPQKTGNVPTKIGEAVPQNLGTNKERYKKAENKKENKANANTGRANFLAKKFLEGKEAKSLPLSVEELPQKSSAKKGVSDEEVIWDMYAQFAEYNSLPLSNPSKARNEACASIAVALRAELAKKHQTTTAAISSEQVLALWYWLLGGLQAGYKLETKTEAKAKVRKECRFFCEDTKSIALFVSQLPQVIKLAQKVNTFHQNASKGDPKGKPTPSLLLNATAPTSNQPQPKPAPTSNQQRTYREPQNNLLWDKIQQAESAQAISDILRLHSKSEIETALVIAATSLSAEQLVKFNKRKYLLGTKEQFQFILNRPKDENKAR